MARVLEPGSSAYSDLAIAADGNILCLYDADIYGQLVLAQFNMEWLEEQV